MSITYRNVLAGAAGQTTGSDSDAYQIEKSLRFNKPDTPSLQQTVGNAGNRRIFTLSAWVKLAAHEHNIILGQWDNTYDGTRLHVDTSGTVRFQSIESNGTAFGCNLHSTRKLRDFSAWYHLCVTVDTTLAVTADRVKIYVNGKRLTSFSTGSYPSKDYQFDWNGTTYTRSIGYWKENNTDYSSAALITEAQHIDGLALSPAAFGSFDSTGVWNPKAFALPAPNDGTTWSSSLTTEGGSFESGYPETNLFDGKLTTVTASDLGGHWIKFTPSGGISYSQSVRIYQKNPDGSDTNNSTFTLTDTDGTVRETRVADNAGQWTTLHQGKGKFTELKAEADDGSNDPSTNWNYWAAIEVDGVILVDGQTDPTTRNNPNDGRNWTSYVTRTGSISDDNLEEAFDGDSSTGQVWGANSSSVTLKPNWTGLKSIRVYFAEVASGSGSAAFKINNTDYTSDAISNGTGWWKAPSSITTLDGTHGLYWSRGSGGSDEFRIGAIEIDGHILIDDSVDNSFHLKFSDTSLNRYLGKDTLNGKIANADGGLPIYNTTDDYGDVKDGTAIRADSNKANLVFAVSGDSIADISNHADLRNSGSPKTITNNNAVVTTNQSRFYGSSISLGNYNENKSFALTQANAGSDFDFGTDSFCFECWSRINSSSHNSASLSPIFETSYDDTGLTGWIMLGYYGDHLHLWWANAAGNGITDTDIDTNGNINDVGKWVHHAVTHDSSTNKFRAFKNGILILEKSAGDFKADWTNGSGLYIGRQNFSSDADRYFKGEISDFRVYKGAAKYTANFKPPTRNDFTVNNLTEAASAVYATPNENDIDSSGNLANGGTPYIIDCSPASRSFQHYSVGGYEIFDNDGGSGNNCYMTGSSNSPGSPDIWRLDLRDFDTVTSVRLNYAGGQAYNASYNSAYAELQDSSKSTISGSRVELSSYDYGWSTLPVSGSPRYIKFDADGETDFRLWLSMIEVNGTVLTNGAHAYEIDVSTDTPTNYGEDTGTGGEVRGNYATWNPLIAAATTFSQGNLKMSWSSEGTRRWNTSTMAVRPGDGRFFVEHILDGGMEDEFNCGFMKAGNLGFYTAGGGAAYSYYWRKTGEWYNLGTHDNSKTVSAWSDGDVLGVAIDYSGSTGSIYLYKNGTAENSGNAVATGLTDVLCFLFTGYNNVAVDSNFGQRAYKHPVTISGNKFGAVCTQNLPDTFSGNELNNPSKYFDVKAYVGSGTDNRDIKGVGFQPDLVWIKSRDKDSSYHYLYDVERGATYALHPNEIDTEEAETTTLKAFNSDGFRLGTHGNVNEINHDTVAWMWDGGVDTTPSNSYNIVPTGQWINDTSGFSITAYTGNGSDDQTLPHGLGAKPNLVIIKNRDNNLGSWVVKHSSLTSGKVLFLETNQAESDSGYGEIKDLDSDVTVTLDDTGNNAVNVNKNTEKYIMYAWTAKQGFSAFGKYTGTGDAATGQFCYTGFLPKFLLVKRYDNSAGAYWGMVDSARSPFNQANDFLYADTDDDEADEGNYHAFDFLSNGFKPRGSYPTTNTSTATYIWAAFASNPFKTARAR